MRKRDFSSEYRQRYGTCTQIWRWNQKTVRRVEGRSLPVLASSSRLLKINKAFWLCFLKKSATLAAIKATPLSEYKNTTYFLNVSRTLLPLLLLRRNKCHRHFEVTRRVQMDSNNTNRQCRSRLPARVRENSAAHATKNLECNMIMESKLTHIFRYIIDITVNRIW